MIQAIVILATVASQVGLCDRTSDEAAFRLAMAKPRECVLSYALKLAPSPDRADLVAGAAVGFCEDDFARLREAAISCKNDRFSTGLDKELRSRFREMALAEVVAFRTSH